MNQTNVLISAEFLESGLQFPEGWKITGASFDENYRGQSGRGVLVLTVEGPDIQAGLEYNGTFVAKVIEGEDGRWVQGNWDIAPWD